MPIYDIKQSSKIPGQIRAYDWLSRAASKALHKELLYRLAQWGVSEFHDGTYILVPEKWKNLDPMDILAMSDLENCPSGQSPRLRYQYSDHCVSFARALGWFTGPPRSGVQLDNFLGIGDHQRMDVSHTCHHNNCIVHIFYEAAHINQNRKKCCAMARRMRQEKRAEEIPEHCEEYNPPCRLQVSATRDYLFHFLRLTVH